MSLLFGRCDRCGQEIPSGKEFSTELPTPLVGSDPSRDDSLIHKGFADICKDCHLSLLKWWLKPEAGLR